MPEQFKVRAIANGFLVSGSHWRGVHHATSKEDALKIISFWLDESEATEKHRLESLHVRTE